MHSFRDMATPAADINLGDDTIEVLGVFAEWVLNDGDTRTVSDYGETRDDIRAGLAA